MTDWVLRPRSIDSRPQMSHLGCRSNVFSRFKPPYAVTRQSNNDNPCFQTRIHHTELGTGKSTLTTKYTEKNSNSSRVRCKHKSSHDPRATVYRARFRVIVALGGKARSAEGGRKDSDLAQTSRLGSNWYGGKVVFRAYFLALLALFG